MQKSIVFSLLTHLCLLIHVNMLFIFSVLYVCCLYVLHGISTYMCVWVYLYMCECVCGGQSLQSSVFCSHSLYILFFEAWSLAEPGAHSIQQNQWVTKAQGSSCVHTLPQSVLGVRNTHCHT